MSTWHQTKTSYNLDRYEANHEVPEHLFMSQDDDYYSSTESSMFSRSSRFEDLMSLLNIETER